MTRTKIAVAVLTILCCAGVATASRPAVQTPAAAQTITAGEDPAVQRWFQNREAMQIELNNALQAARGITGPSRQATAICTRLTVVSRKLQTYEHIPVASLDGPVNAGIDQFQRAGRACLTGDHAAMRRFIDEGTTARAEAQHHIDELLHGEE
jgi:hypothetical protein